MKQEKTGKRLSEVYVKKVNCDYFHANKFASSKMQLCMQSFCRKNIARKELCQWHQPDLCQSHTCQWHAVTVKKTLQNQDQS